MLRCVACRGLRGSLKHAAHLAHLKKSSATQIPAALCEGFSRTRVSGLSLTEWISQKGSCTRPNARSMCRQPHQNTGYPIGWSVLTHAGRSPVRSTQGPGGTVGGTPEGRHSHTLTLLETRTASQDRDDETLRGGSRRAIPKCLRKSWEQNPYTRVFALEYSMRVHLFFSQ